MIPWRSVISLAHLIGLALAAGSATVKLVLLFRCRAHPGFAATSLFCVILLVWMAPL